MPLQNYGAIMGSMADTVSQPMNSFLAMQDRNRVLGQTEEELRQRAAIRQQTIQQQQQDQAAAAQVQQRKAEAQQRSATLLAMVDNPQYIPEVLSQAKDLPPSLQNWQQMDPRAVHAEIKKEYIMFRAQNADILGQEADQGPKIGQYNPGDYTPPTWSQFMQTKDPSVLQRQYAPPAPPNMTVVQLPQGQAAFNPRTGATQPLSTADAQNQAAASRAQAVAGGTAAGTAAGKAASDLPSIEENAKVMNDTLDGLEKSPGFHYLWGAYSLTPGGAVPGTSQADALSYLDQIGGQVFLQAYNTLKGGGQITEIEGKQATAAITRLRNRSISEASAKKAIQELRTIIGRGVARARNKAKATGSAPTAAPTQSQGSVVDFSALPE